MWLKLGFFLLVVLCCSAQKARYDSFKVYRVYPNRPVQVKALKSLSSARQGFDFWTPLRNGGAPVDIMIPPNKLPQFYEFIREHGLSYSVYIDDVQRLINREESRIKFKPRAFGWTEYYEIDEIYDWLATLEQQYPDVVTQVVGGSTYEGREIRGIEINFDENNPGVFLESGIHAREWIGPAASSWIVNEILRSPADSIWRRFNYLYFPSANPDGYAYTFSHDRLWRKTRQPYDSIFGTCYGADPNRNWDNHWLEGGSSTFPCDETFAGSEPFSEIETRSLSNYLSQVGSRYDIWVGFHSYSQLLLFPWGWTPDPAPHHDLWQRIGDLAAADLEAVNGLQFDVGDIYHTIYEASGSSMEWFYGKFNNTLAYTFETRDTGRYGFVLPPEQIIPGAKELQAAIRRFLIEYEGLFLKK